MLEKAIQTSRRGPYTHVQYARFADDMVILIDSFGAWRQSSTQPENVEFQFSVSAVSLSPLAETSRRRARLDARGGLIGCRNH